MKSHIVVYVTIITGIKDKLVTKKTKKQKQKQKKTVRRLCKSCFDVRVKTTRVN